MNAYFRRQMSMYSRYHRDPGNCVMHWLGIPAIFFAVLVILAIRPLPIGGSGIAVGTLLLVPATMLWLALDASIGGVLLVMIVPLAVAAEWIARTSGITLTLLIASAAFVTGWLFLIVGHLGFERRKPALVDDMSLMFIGPMFIVAKALVALGLRADLAPVLDEAAAHQI
jgi:uncharacterized membrane protein YGL010W